MYFYFIYIFFLGITLSVHAAQQEESSSLLFVKHILTSCSSFAQFIQHTLVDPFAQPIQGSMQQQDAAEQSKITATLDIIRSAALLNENSEQKDRIAAMIEGSLMGVKALGSLAQQIYKGTKNNVVNVSHSVVRTGRKLVTLRACMEYENELLASVGEFPVAAGLYRRDLIEVPAATLSIAVDMWLLKKVRLERIKYVTEAILKDCDLFREVLYDNMYKICFVSNTISTLAGAGVVAPFEIRTLGLKAEERIQEYVQQHHAYVGYVPLKPNIIMLSARVLFEELLDSIKRRLLISCSKDELGRVTEATIFDDGCAAYKRNPEGKLFRVLPAISLTTLLAMSCAPHVLIAKNDGVIFDLRYYATVSLMHMIGLSENRIAKTALSWCFSTVGGLCLKLLTTGWTVAAFDKLNLVLWQQYVNDHFVELLEILDDCCKRDEAGMVRAEARERLLNFVKEGHIIQTMNILNWATVTRNIAENNTASFISVPIIATAMAGGMYLLYNVLF